MACTRWLCGLALALLMAGGPSALAMGIRREITVLARAADASTLPRSARFRARRGGELTYRVDRKTRGASVDFLVSSDLGPGDGSHPQTVSNKDCERRVAALGAELTKRKILRVTLHPGRCRTRSREGLVEVSTP